MDALELARWQFAITTVYHFLFVPITIGLSAIVAGYHTAWVRTHNPAMYKMTRFLGKLFIINFALGLATGIVQEFQFGMNWSDYSRMVGDIFGAPLAFEALLTFFLESVFIGVWVFGWGRIPEKLHAATMWLVHIGTVLSAFFILSANSWMQNPVGYHINPDNGRAELTDFVAVLTNKVQLVAFPHVITAAYMTAGGLVMAISLWHLRRLSTQAPALETIETEAGAPSHGKGRGGAHAAITDGTNYRETYRKAARVGAIVTLVASLGVIVTGDLQGKVMTQVQPMKMAAAEGVYQTEAPAPFSVFATGNLEGTEATHWIQVPGLLSYLGKGNFSAEIEGINDIKAEYKTKYADSALTNDTTTEFTPYVPVAYWTFRIMIGLGMLGTAMSLLTLWITRKKGDLKVLRPKWWHWAIIATPFFPLLGNSFGWIFTEMGRQPWAVQGVLLTRFGVSPRTSATEVLISMIVYTLLYGALAVVEVKLFLKYLRRGAEDIGEPPTYSHIDDEDRPLVYTY
ncbi:cytochrome ubiquinol oxidase subunit I [Gephyromycinifex aptenodytis]|uniref:cytochrome ubiquinol oxidase subunit I n=1 Tax=Gephyromycinifex aptenodytis TaxID=2716227 RepID=UPI0014473B9A|nr:cytochrome ubiquinol oxidase subunit I [Gephyromycinifex aptenodytis]